MDHFAQIRATAAPQVVLSIDHHPRFDRIQMNVAQECEKVGIDVDQPCTVAAFEQMTPGAQLAMPIARVVARNGDSPLY